MSILFSSEQGWIISHHEYTSNIYKNVKNGENFISYQLKKQLFDINSPFLRFNQNLSKYYDNNQKKENPNENGHEIDKMATIISKKFYEFLKTAPDNIFSVKNNPKTHIDQLKNDSAKELASKCYEDANKIFSGFGQNGDQSSLQEVNGEPYLFPNNCTFYNKNIDEMGLLSDKIFDLIVMDPPWWNKAIRRKRKRNQSYDMMYNIDLTKIPVQNLLSDDGLVVIWCTNSLQNYNQLVESCLPKWGIEICATWFWIKVTRSGEPICKFGKPGMKQPYEQILIAKRKTSVRKEIPDKKIIISVPSAINSHKPPLIEILKPYIVNDARCLEIFARYLLPNLTSWGLEAIKLQHISLYEEIK